MFPRTPVVAVVVGVATLLAGLLAVTAEVPPWLILPLGAPFVVAAAVTARVRLHGSERLAAVPAARRTMAAWLVTLGAVLHVAWVTAWTWSPSWGWWLVPGLPVMAWAECGATLITRRTLLKPRTRTDERRRQRRQQHQAPPAVRRMRAALDEGEWGYVQVSHQFEQPSPSCTVYHVSVPAKATARLLQEENTPDAKRTLTPFDERSGPALAAALSQVLRVPLREKWVQINSTGYAGRYDVVVMTRDVNEDIHPYVDDLRPITLDTPCRLGIAPNGTTAELNLQGHGVIVAASGKGKTNLLYLLVSHLLRAGAVIWVGGRRKQYETWAQYLLKYLDSRHQMVIDWLVNGQRDTVTLLLATWLLAQDRQATPFHERADWPPLYAIIDEATDVLVDTSIGIEYQGVWYTASELLAMISRGVKSAHVYVVLVLHRYVNGQFGHEGGNIKVAFDWTIVLASNDPADAPRALGVGNLHPLEHPGELYARRGNGPLIRCKAFYVQEIGKPQAPKTGGITTAEVGWARREMANTLTGRDATAAGPHYAARPRLVTAEFMAYLQLGADDVNGVDERPATGDAHGPTSQARRGGNLQDIEDRAFAEKLAALEAAAGLQPSTPQPEPAPAPTSRRKYVRRDAVLQLLRDHGPMDSGQLIELLRANGDAVTNPISVYNLLNTMLNRDQVLVQQADGKTYDLAERAGAAA